MLSAIDKNNSEAVSLYGAAGCRTMSLEEIHQRRIYDSKRDVERYSFQCPECAQDVFLAARNVDGRNVFYFSHLANSNECSLKVSDMSEHESIKDESKENELKEISSESEMHKDIKNTIYWALGRDKSDIAPVSIEKRYYNKALDGSYTDFIKGGKWRVPDVLGKHKDGFDIAFEVQCSYISPKLLSNRCNFYKENNAFVIWILPSVSGVLCPSQFMIDEKQGSIYRSDLFFNNKSNIFSMDAEALNKTKETGVLHLKVFYEEYSIDNYCWRVVSKPKSKMITINDVKYCYDSNTCYYIDMSGVRCIAEERSKYISDRAEAHKKKIDSMTPSNKNKYIKIASDIGKYFNFHNTDVITLKINGNYKSYKSLDHYYAVYSLVANQLTTKTIDIGIDIFGYEKESDKYGECYTNFSACIIHNWKTIPQTVDAAVGITESVTMLDCHKNYYYTVQGSDFDEMFFPEEITIRKNHILDSECDSLHCFDFTSFDIFIDKNASDTIYSINNYNLYMIDSFGKKQYIGWLDPLNCNGRIHCNMCHNKKAVNLTYTENNGVFHIKAR